MLKYAWFWASPDKQIGNWRIEGICLIENGYNLYGVQLKLYSISIPLIFYMDRLGTPQQPTLAWSVAHWRLLWGLGWLNTTKPIIPQPLQLLPSWPARVIHACHLIWGVGMWNWDCQPSSVVLIWYWVCEYWDVGREVDTNLYLHSTPADLHRLAISSQPIYPNHPIII